MAIHEGYDKINSIKDLKTDFWEGKTGIEVEDFLSRRLLNPLGSVIDYAGEILSIRNPEGDVIAQGNVSVVPPNYITEITFTELYVNGKLTSGDVAVNYTETTTFAAGINVKTYYEASGKFYDLSSKVNLTFYLEGTTDQLVVKNIVPNKRDDDSIQLIDITPLFQKNMQGAKITVSVSANGASDEATYNNSITVHKIELSTSSTHVADQKVVFDIKNLDSIDGMSLYYYDVPLGTEDLSNIPLQYINLKNNFRVEVPLEIGGHQILARISDDGNKYYSNWVQANVISYDDSNKQGMMAIIGGIPETIKNCENSKLFQIISVPGLGGTVDIVSYLSDSASVFQDSQDKWPVFNRTSITTDSNDEETVQDYYSYIELTNLNNSYKAVAFSLVIDGVSYNIYSLYISNGRLSGSNVFTIQIEENPYNVNKIFNYAKSIVSGCKSNSNVVSSLLNTIKQLKVFLAIQNEVECKLISLAKTNAASLVIPGYLENSLYFNFPTLLANKSSVRTLTFSSVASSFSTFTTLTSFDLDALFVFDVDVVGGVNLKRIFGDKACSVFIMPPSIEELERRLIGRGTDAPEVIAKRVAKAGQEIERAPEFDHVVVNDDLQRAIADTCAIIDNFIAQ